MVTLRSSRVVTPDGVRPASIRVEDGVVVEVGDRSADRDHGDLVIFPGLVDSHVHVNEPGRTEWEGFASATSAALAGGTTTIVDMPLNSIPPTTSVPALEAKRAAANGRISVDVAFWGGIVPGSTKDVDSLVGSGVCGFKVFTTDSGVPEFPPVDQVMLDGMTLNVPLLVHAEATDLLGAAGANYASYLASRPPEAEAAAIERVAAVDAPIHILHVSSGHGVDAIVRHPGMTGETCPHYLTFTDDDVTGVEFKCAPPIRGVEHREALWEALRSGTLDLVVSDHSPAPPGLKRGDFASAWGGISSLQIRLPVVWDGATRRGFDLVDVVGWLAGGPARLAGLEDRKGSIEVGKDADLVVFDPDGVTKVSGRELLHRHPLTPYEGMEFRGRLVDTMLGSPARMLTRT